MFVIILTTLNWVFDIIAIIFYDGYEASFWLFMRPLIVLSIIALFATYIVYPILYKIYKKIQNKKKS